MLSRRVIRIKAMQALYAYEQEAYQADNTLQKYLLNSIQNIFRSYLQVLVIIEKIAEYTQKDLEAENSRHISRQHNISTKILETSVVSFLRTNELFQKILKNEKIEQTIGSSWVKEIYKAVKESEYYNQFIASPNEKNEVIAALVKETIADNDDIDNYMEEHFPSWQYDKHIVIPYILKTVKQTTDGTLPLSFEWKEETTFAVDLLNKSILHTELYKDLIQSKAKNWEVDRITMIDMLLMKMAICEMMEFPSIPIKVTMDEYIEISKMYSTPKSKDFINGILDKLAHELKAEGKIVKTGRGLVD